MPVFNEQGSKLARILREKAQLKQPIDVMRIITLCTLDVICGESYKLFSPFFRKLLSEPTKLHLASRGG